MTDLPVFRRDLLFKAFNGDRTLVSAFEQLVRYVTDAAANAGAGAAVADVLGSASLLTLRAVEGWAGARTLVAGDGLALVDDGARVTASVTGAVPLVDGGYPVSFIVTGETDLILPRLGTLATLADLSGAVAGSVTSFNTRTGPVSLTSGDVTTALGYVPTSVVGLTGSQSVAAFKTGLSLVKGDVGLGSVDNTADAAKVVLSASKLTTARNIAITGDISWTVTFDGSAAVTAAGTLATVNASPGTYGGASKTLTGTVNAKGLVTSLAEQAIAITASQVTDFSEATDDRVAALVQNGTGITWSYNDGAGTLTPTVTITQYTDEMAQDAVGAMVDGSLVYVDATPLLTRAALTGDVTAPQGSNATTVVKINGVSLAGLGTGILKNTTGTGVPSIAVAADFPTLNQNTTGSAAKLTTARNINGVAFDGTAAITVNLSAARTIAMSGDVVWSVSFDGSANVTAAGTIQSGVVTLAKMADMATASLIYRKTAGTGAPEVNTLATLKTDLGLTGTNSGDQTITLTGDVTGSGTGSFAATIGANKVTFAKLVAASAASIVGATAAGNFAELTPSSARTVLSLVPGTDVFKQRTITAPAAGITVSNGDGVSGNPTLALANDLAALEALSGTNTIYYRSAADTWSAVTIAGNLGFSAGTLGSSLGTMATQAASAVAITGGTIYSLTGLGIGTTAASSLLEIYVSQGGADATAGGLILSRYKSGANYRGGAIYSRYIGAVSQDCLVIGVTTVDAKNPYSDFDQARAYFASDGSFGVGAFTSLGGGSKVIGIPNATTDPASNPSGGGVLYCSGGALKFRGSSGTVTTLGPA